jgi:hypothetical protein
MTVSYEKTEPMGNPEGKWVTTELYSERRLLAGLARAAEID